MQKRNQNDLIRQCRLRAGNVIRIQTASPVDVLFTSVCLTSLTRAKCGTRSTLCWKVGNISGSTELFAL